MKTALTAVAFVLGTLAGGCTSGNEDTPASSPAAAPSFDRRSLRSIQLPNLSDVAESVQAQVRQQHESLTRLIENPASTNVELGTAYGEMGKLLMAAEYLDAAEPCYLHAQALVPDQMRWPYYLGHIYRIRGEPAKAAKFFERALELRPADAAALVWLGDIDLDRGRPEAAEPLFAKARSLEPRSVAALFGLGRAALAKREYVRAVEYLEEALSLDRRASVIHYPLALAYRGLGELGKAETHLRQRGDVEVAPPDPLMTEIAGMVESAVAYESRGVRALNAGEFPVAVTFFRKGVELDPDNPSLRHKLGTALSLTGDTRAAVAQFEEAVRRAPEFAKAHYSLGVLLTASGRHQAAIERFSAAVRSEPNYIEARLQLAEALRRTGRPDTSLAHYEQVLASDPRVAAARFGHAMALVGLGRYREAHARLMEATRLHPDRPEFANALARLPATLRPELKTEK